MLFTLRNKRALNAIELRNFLETIIETGETAELMSSVMFEALERPTHPCKESVVRLITGSAMTQSALCKNVSKRLSFDR
jgi:hypothetical protein